MVSLQTALTQSVQIKSEYTDATVIAQVLTRARFTQTEPQQITAHYFGDITSDILWYQIDGDKAFPIPVDEFNRIWEAIKEEQTPQFKIVFDEYVREDGIVADVVAKTENGVMEFRHCWTVETLDEPIFCLETADGKVLSSEWKTSRTNRWLKAYKSLWNERNQKRVSQMETIARQQVDEDEIAFIRSLEAGMYR